MTDNSEVFREGNENMNNEEFEDKTQDNDILLTDAPQEEVDEPRTDWKAEAIRAQTRLQMLEQARNEKAPANQMDESEALRREIEEVRANMPALDEKNPQTFWDREKAQEKLAALQEKAIDVRLRKQERALAEQHTTTVVQSYKVQHANRPEFKAVEKQFDQMVQGLEPHLRGNQTMLDLIRKNLEYDQITKGRNMPKQPPSAPNAAYQPQAQASQQNRSKVTWRSEGDKEVGEYYMRRGIISGPEDFYDPKFNERSKSANNNGVAIYDVPTSKRGWRR